MKTISSFRALDMYRYPVGDYVPKIVTTWWRQSGKLCVAGASDVVNVWDCPAERCIKVGGKVARRK
jgi:regulator-associated protein of mTOR